MLSEIKVAYVDLYEAEMSVTATGVVYVYVYVDAKMVDDVLKKIKGDKMTT
jgi:hypothetical protein